MGGGPPLDPPLLLLIDGVWSGGLGGLGYGEREPICGQSPQWGPWQSPWSRGAAKPSEADNSFIIQQVILAAGGSVFNYSD